MPRIRAALVVACSLAGACQGQTPDPPAQAPDPSGPQAKAGAQAEPEPPAKEPGPTVAEAVIDELTAARIDSARTHMQALSSAVEMFRLQTPGACPESVAALVDARVFPRRDPDPWGNEYVITCEAEGAHTVRSSGPDREAGTADDIVVSPSAP